ncbi:MAG: metallophosphoesterase [Patescibacteria group bacterium]
MKIAVVSDSHGNVANFKKIVQWLNKEDIKLILHCGDIGNPESLKESLADFSGEFFGVFGNMDKDFKIFIEEYNKIPRVKIEEKILETEIPSADSGQVKKIAITHYPEEARNLAETGRYDLVFYGHTHKPWEEKVGNCQLINPGESAGQFYKPTFAVYDIATGELELKILEKL